MATNTPTPNYSADLDTQESSLEKNQQLQYFFFRIFPYWPFVFLALALGIFTGYLLLRYATPLYQVRARLAVNDDSQQRSANLQEIIKLDTRNITSETEKEIELLRSTDMLKKVASALQLNVMYTQEGSIKSGQAYSNTPFTLELKYPDSVKKAFSGQVEIIGNTVKFNNEVFPKDTFLQTKYGEIRWIINNYYSVGAENDKWMVTVVPVKAAAKQIKGKLSIAPISKGSTILDLGYIDAFPSRGIAILNSLMTVYGSSWLEYKSRIYENTQKFLDGRISLISDELTGVESRLQAFKKRENIVDLDQEGSMFLNKIRQTDARLAEIGIQLDILGETEKYVNQRNKSLSDPIPATLGIADPVLTTLLNQLFQTEFQLEKLRQTSGEKNPQIEVMEQMIAKLRPSIVSSINNLKVNLQTTRRKLESENAITASTINRIPDKERALLDISRQQGIKNAIYTFLLQKKEESAIAAAAIVPNYRVMEEPDFGWVISPKKQNYYAISIAVALLLAVLYIYLKEFANSRLLFRSQIESRLKIPILGELVFKTGKESKVVVVGEGKRTLIAEQFRELRTNLSFAIPAKADNKAKVVLVTSSIPSEGKSFVAVNTSVSFCLTGARVVLLEFDLRKPKISKPLGIRREPGITNYLIGSATETDIIQPHSSIANFFVIPSGPVPPNPAELIGSDRLGVLMDYLKDNFDYVIIDSPPVASVTDAKLLAVYADLTMYIIRHNFTNSVFLKLISDIYQKRNMPNINLVFNGIVNKKVLGYGYGKGYGYGYGYAYGYGYGYGYIDDDHKEKNWLQKLVDKIFRRK
jgi:capsular exopolysaccharide synthesis family protein